MSTTLRHNLSRCLACGYRLRGLPGHGNCPECGARYGDGEIIVFGWPTGPAATVLASRGKWLLIALGSLLGLALPFALLNLRALIALDPSSIAFFACLVILVIVMLAPRYTHPMEETVRLRLRVKGFRVEPTWSLSARQRVALHASALACLALWLLMAPAGRPGDLVGQLLVAWIIYHWYTQTHQETRVVPWDWCREIRLERIAPERWMLQIYVDPQIAGIGRELPASMEMELHDDEADVLRRWLKRLSNLPV